jgi:hypothetical protein
MTCYFFAACASFLFSARVAVGCSLDAMSEHRLSSSKSRTQSCQIGVIALRRRLQLSFSSHLRMSTRRFALVATDLLSRQEDGDAPPPPHHDSPVVAFIIGLAIILLASILNAAGLNLTKLDHVRYLQTLVPTGVPPNGVGSLRN